MENFLKNARYAHGDKFDYSSTEYKSTKEKITISCIKHNINIHILPYNHIKQVYGGCALCRQDDKYKHIVLPEGEKVVDVNIDIYKDLYLVSNKGRCFSKITGKELSPTLRTSYHSVGLWHLSNKKFFCVHYIVYVSFHNDYDKSKVIDHIDGNKLNNCIENLRLVSQSTNLQNAYSNNENMYQQQPVQMLDKITNKLVREFDTITDARKFVGLKLNQSIVNCIKGILKTSGGYKWQYKHEIIEPVESQSVSTFVSIGKIGDTDFSNYSIDRNGCVINIKHNNRKVKTFINASGYETIYLYSSSSMKHNLLIHRLLGKYFLPDGHAYYFNNKYVINHKDKNKQNNSIDNIEWISIQENAIHGCGRKVAMIDKKTDEVIRTFQSISEAYKYLGKERTSLISKVCKGVEKGRVSAHGYKWKYI